ncbi:MAG TPA: hypothetical protein VFK56_16400, partial [Mycobacterium sp.]|nr:hypothetical protein [Mycobacterium sp.]
GASDASSADTAFGFTYAFDCGSGYGTFGASSTASCPTTDNGARAVKGKIQDKDGGVSEYTANVTINNVAPTIVPTPFFAVNPVTGEVSASATWTDPGFDTETVTFEYFRGTASVGSRTFSNQSNAGTASDNVTRVLPGCGALSMVVTVTDDDAGSTQATVSSGSNDVYTASFQAPIKANERNIAKFGNVVPIKVNVVSSCTGAAVTGLTLHITIANGDVDNVQPDATPEIVAESVSNADTGTQMRPNGTGYIYNFSTKQLKANQDYTIRIRSLSISGAIIAKALFQPKK